MLRHWIAVVVAAGSVLAADEWPNFLGPNYDNISREGGLKTDWSSPLKLVWERNVGDSFSSFAIAGGRAYTCGTKDGKQVLLALNANDGAIVWEFPIENAYFEAQGGSGTRATPTVRDGKVYILGATGRLACVATADGKLIWEHKFSDHPQWGYSGSVLVDGQLAIVSIGGKQGALIAFDKDTGKQVWKSGTQPVGYSTPYPFSFEGKRYICGFLGESAVIAQADDGKQVWELGWKTDWNVNAATPIFHDGYLFLSSGYDHGATLVKLAKQGDKITHTKVWESKVLLCKFQSAVLLDGHLYCSDDKGLKCVEFLTGNLKWEKKRVEHGTMVIAEGHFFLLTEKGELIIAPATPEKYEPKTTAQILSGRCWTLPVLCNGRIFARDLDRLVCFSLKAAD